jgi:hypothetical protein
MVSVPLNFTLANARSPIRFRLAGKKVEVSVVSANKVGKSNAFSEISTILKALSAFPFPLYVELVPEYTDGIAGNAPQFANPYVPLELFMPLIASVLLLKHLAIDKCLI